MNKMNLNFPLLDQSIKIEGPTVFVVEDVSLFAKLVKLFYLYDGEENELKLYTNRFESLKLNELVVITDILGYDINTNSVLKLIYTDLEMQLNSKPEVKTMLDKLSMKITELISYELLDNELDLEYDEITIQELFKSLGIKIETKSDTIFEKLIEIIQVFRYLAKKKLLVLINIGTFLTKNELDKFLEYIRLSQIDVLLLERKKLYDFPQILLDEDYFLQIFH